MFDWFWKFLYTISEVLFEIVDGMLGIANKLCGVEPIEVAGKRTSFMLTMLENQNVMYAFIGVGVVGIFLLMIFGVIAICRNCKDNKKSSAQIAITTIKTLIYFLLVPSLMFAFTFLLNRLVVVIYTATQAGSTDMGEFLFKSFLPSGMDNFTGSVDWRSTSDVSKYMARAGYSLEDYRFFFSWIICIPLLICIAKALLMFVDRTLSILILFIMSPISLSTTVLDDGARFKMWREKVIAKFISGYGMIIAINIYTIVLSFITRGDVNFFPETGAFVSTIANFLLKCAFAIGGAYFLPKVFGLVGDLFTQGGGSREFQEADSAYKDMKQAYREFKSDRRQSKADDEKKAKEKKEREGKANKALGAGGSSGNANNNKVPKSGGGAIASAVTGAITGTIESGVDAAKTAGQEGANTADQADGKKGGGGDKDGKEGGNKNDKKVAGGDSVKNAVSSSIAGASAKK